MSEVDGVVYQDLGVCVVVDDGAGKTIGITHEQFRHLVSASLADRERLRRAWREEVALMRDRRRR